MKPSLIIFLITVLKLGAISQEAKIPLIDQVMISCNTTLENGYRTENRSGFGLGVYHSSLPPNWLNFIAGIEFNQTRLFKETAHYGHFGSYNDITYTKNCITLPLNLRMTIGRKIKYFIEAGGFWDWVISSRRKGILHSFVPDGYGQPNHVYFSIDEPAHLGNSLGVSFGLGIRIPANHFELVVKPEFKQKFKNRIFEKDLGLSEYLRLSLGMGF